jgi:ParB-like chromosome segregation protein Spo0J
VTNAPRIPAALAALARPIDSLKPYPGNAKRHDLDGIAESLRRRGQYRLAVVQSSSGYVVAGNGMLAAALAEGWTELAAVDLDVDDEEAARLVLSDNRLQELGGYELGDLAELLAGLPTLTATGYDESDLADLLALTAPPTLDELAAAVGDPDEDDLLVRLTLRVLPEDAVLWRQAVTEAEKQNAENPDAVLVRAVHAALCPAS